MKYRIRLVNPILGVPVTYVEKVQPRERERELLGHEHDTAEHGDIGQFETNGNGVYKRLLIRLSSR